MEDLYYLHDSITKALDYLEEAITDANYVKGFVGIDLQNKLETIKNALETCKEDTEKEMITK